LFFLLEIKIIEWYAKDVKRCIDVCYMFQIWKQNLESVVIQWLHITSNKTWNWLQWSLGQIIEFHTKFNKCYIDRFLARSKPPESENGWKKKKKKHMR